MTALWNVTAHGSPPENPLSLSGLHWPQRAVAVERVRRRGVLPRDSWEPVAGWLDWLHQTIGIRRRDCRRLSFPLLLVAGDVVVRANWSYLQDNATVQYYLEY